MTELQSGRRGEDPAGGPHIVVVGAAILRGGALLAAQRAAPASLRGRWELPGGKVDPGESDTEALVRECREELGVPVRPLRRIGGEEPLPPRGDGTTAVLRVWAAELVEGEPRAVEHLALRWLRAGELDGVDWLPADLPFLEAVRPFLR
ncbi:(deoxy)nucleoside triphosphate pyrophosphohydrolase [Nocardiopsis potens]|uniref:(deoxy)nucleoside triphosphate pyrophosphohydrolase n=1 Tax=Nocardiopsis potens TaxID=1246458 RepID=UPI000348893F|nr:(deoxy)nucleoside triphosphate pyrophosphohydrolase [Nocardiopsis potens]